MNEYMVLFFTHSGAIKFGRKARKEDFPCELMPVPRQLSSNCGVGAKIQYNGTIDSLVDEEIEKIYAVTPEGYEMKYSEE